MSEFVVAGRDVSAELVAAIKVDRIEGGSPLPCSGGGLSMVPGKLPGATGPTLAWLDGRKVRLWWARP